MKKKYSLIDPRILAVRIKDLSKDEKRALRKRNLGLNDRVPRWYVWNYRAVEKREDHYDKLWHDCRQDYVTMCATMGLSPIKRLRPAIKQIGDQLDRLARKKERFESRLLREKFLLMRLAGRLTQSPISDDDRYRMVEMRDSIMIRQRDIGELEHEIDVIGWTAHEVLGHYFPWDKESRRQLFSAAKAVVKAEEAKTEKK